MRESPVIALLKLFWWIPLLIGLVMLAFGTLVKALGVFGTSPEKLAFAQSVQFLSIIFIGLSAVSFLISLSGEFIAKWVQLPDAGGSKVQVPPPAPPPPPPPPRKKYTDRDFMPPDLRAEVDAKEGKPVDERLRALPPARTLDDGNRV